MDKEVNILTLKHQQIPLEVLVIIPDYLDDIQGSAVLVGGHLRSFKDTSAAYIRRTSVNVENEIEGSRSKK